VQDLDEPSLGDPGSDPAQPAQENAPTPPDLGS
jgi:hypothetical protein